MRARVLILVVLLTGCGFFSRTKNTYYSLEPLPYEGPRTTTPAPIAVEGIELPPGLDRRELAVRGESGQLDVRGNHLWAAPLEDMVIHTLAFDLANRLPEGSVILPGQAKPSGGVRTIFIVFEDFTAGPENTLTLDARWTAGGATTHEEIAVPVASLDSAAIVTAMNEALVQLAERIVAAPPPAAGP
jgi:uncharacterized lipoprotein YmbA